MKKIISIILITTVLMVTTVLFGGAAADLSGTWEGPTYAEEAGIDLIFMDIDKEGYPAALPVIEVSCARGGCCWWITCSGTRAWWRKTAPIPLVPPSSA